MEIVVLSGCVMVVLAKLARGPDADNATGPGAGAKPARIGRAHGSGDLGLAAASSRVRKATIPPHALGVLHDTMFA